MSTTYRQAPEDTDRMPGGVPYIVGNEAAERFSYYGMKAILMVFRTQHLRDASGAVAPLSDDDAKKVYHLFAAGAYFFPILGALVADTLFGKYRTIMALSVVYCLGHFALALDETQVGLYLGLGLIALGAGGIKPCVSAHVGDQFGERNQHLLERVFAWFYFSINAGAFISTLLTPVLLERSGPAVAFGIPGVLMVLATAMFFVGRHRFAHIPPGGTATLRELASRQGAAIVSRLFALILFIAMFWALYDQNGSAWVLQAERMDRELFGITLLASQIQAVNPILVMLLIPLFSYVVYPGIARVWTLTPLRKIGVGFLLTALTFVISAVIEMRLDAGDRVSIGWQVFAFIVLTTAEVMVYGTGLEFFYAQAPNKLKSIVMGLFLLSVSLGNLFTALVNEVIQNADGSSKLEGASYYLFFAALMGLTTIAYVFYAVRYREQRFIQGAAP
jgi:proton-dependent oligopeptide transporter, POT family